MNTRVYPMWDSTDYESVSDIELVFILETLRDKQYVNIADDETDNREVNISEFIEA